MSTASATLNRPALRYFQYGSKWRIAPWIIAQFPPHRLYVEPFAGGFAVGLRRPPAAFEVYNDLDGEVVNFFRVLRGRPEALIRAIDLTPYSRTECELGYAPVDAAEELERARRFYVRSWQAWSGGRGKWRQGWRWYGGRQSTHAPDPVRVWNSTDHLDAVAARLKQVQLECDDALAVIRRTDGPETLFYVDPPYVPDSRGERWRLTGYQHELDDDGHRALAEALRACRGMVALSGYPSALYDALYPDWQRACRDARDGLSQRRTECLWLSPALVARQERRQLALEVDACA